MSRAATTRDRTRSARRGGAGAAPGASRRRRRRRDRRPHPRRRQLLTLGLLVVVLAVGAWAVFVGPVLAVHTVQVDGARTLTSDQVVTAAAVDEGTPLARVDTDAVAERIALLPQVASVEVTLGWPDTVVVTLAERLPVAVVVQAGARVLMDRDGVLFDTITGEPPAGVVPLDVPRPGPDDPATRAALGALVALPQDVRSVITGISAVTPDGVELTLTDGRTVRWGSADQTPRKARVLGALLDQIEAGTLGEAQLLDVSTPDSVVLR